MPAGLYNMAAKAHNYNMPMPDSLKPVRDFLNKGIDDLPLAPREILPEGIKKKLFDPTGNRLFGIGSQEKQEGLIERGVDIFADWLPAALLSPGKALTKAATAAYPAIAGVTAKALGLGETGQKIAELSANPVMSIAGILSPSRISKSIGKMNKSLENVESKVWAGAEKATSRVGKIENVSRKAIIKDLKVVNKKLGDTVPLGSREGLEITIGEIQKTLKRKNVSGADIHNARTKLGNSWLDSKINKSTPSLKEAKAVIDKELLKYPGVKHADALSATKAKFAFQKSDIFREYKRSESKAARNLNLSELSQLMAKIAPYGSAAVSLFFKSPKTAMASLGVGVVAKTASAIKKIAHSPELRKEAVKLASESIKNNAKTIFTKSIT